MDRTVTDQMQPGDRARGGGEAALWGGGGHHQMVLAHGRAATAHGGEAYPAALSLGNQKLHLFTDGPSTVPGPCALPSLLPSLLGREG